MISELKCVYCNTNSFYGKAKVKTTNEGGYVIIDLISYTTNVARITIGGGKTIYECFGKYSPTTTRHQKEVFKQNGLNDNEIKQILKEGGKLCKS